MKNYATTLDYLYTRLPMFTRIGEAAYKKDLHNTVALLNVLGNPQNTFKSIHIAGTNGKGSTSHMLAAIFQANGYKVGLYTSPHLKDFRERIKSTGEAGEIALQMIPENFVVEFTNRMVPHIEAIEPSFFELTVAMAFEYFASLKLDVAIIETGLGGRLDSTNIITPLLSIITNIGWDHMNLLGDSLEKIAAEKAGIIKPGVPVLVGETLPETKPVFEAMAKSKNSPLHFPEIICPITAVETTVNTLEITVANDGKKKTWQTDLAGLYQQYNLRTVICALPLLKTAGFTLDDELTREGLNHVKNLTGLMGRWQILRQQPRLVLDVAHNEHGIREVLKQLGKAATEGKVHIIMGMVRDKEIDKVLQLLPKTYAYYFTNANIPRALPAAELLQKAQAAGLNGMVFNEVNTAIAHAIEEAGTGDTVLVCGSVFVVAEVDQERWEDSAHH